MASSSSSVGPPVLIFGGHITALGVLRVLTARGVVCYVAEETSDIIVRSRWYRAAERAIPETADSEALASYLDRLELPGAVLIPCSDRWIRAVSGLPDATRGRFAASVPPAEAVAQCVDKERFLALVERLGLPHPRTVVISSTADLDAVDDGELLNGFLKPTESQRYFARYGNKGAFVESRAEARHLVEDATTAGITFMLQEYIPGEPTKTILLDGFVDTEGVIRAMVARRRLRMDPPRIANTCADVTIPLAEVAEAAAAAERLLAEVRYRGVFNVEFKFDERDGHFKIIELNPRPFWLIAHIASAGADLAWMSYLDALGRPVPTLERYRIGRYGVYEVPDAAALMRAWTSLRRPSGPVLRPWLRGDRALFRWSDPLPAAVDIGRAVRRRVGLGGAARTKPAEPAT
jgi:D-aspartate ligase